MSEFAKKYNLKDEQVSVLIKDGWLSCSIPLYDKVVIHYRNSRSMQKTADELGISKSEVCYIMGRLG